RTGAAVDEACAALYRLGVWGIPLATSIVNVLGTIALLVLLRDRLGRFETRPVAVTYLRVVVASLVAGGVAVGAWFTIDQGVGRSLIGQIVSVGIALGVGTGAYLVLARLLGIRELNALLSLVRRRR
ncbi:MAG: hypothetical protein ACE5EV_00085, partial [Gaiellales bacterium]